MVQVLVLVLDGTMDGIMATAQVQVGITTGTAIVGGATAIESAAN